MEQNNIQAAPAIKNPMELYPGWHMENHGKKHDFLDFLSNPSLERDRFLSRLTSQIEVTGSVYTLVFSV